MNNKNINHTKTRGVSHSSNPSASEHRVLGISELVRDQRLQVRTALDRCTVSNYARAFANEQEFPPVTVADIGGALYLLDGWHRIAALERNGESEVKAEIFAISWKDAQMRAFTANLQHGLPLRTKEKRLLFQKYMRAGLWKGDRNRPKSSREIAADLSGIISHSTVLNRIRQDFPWLARHWEGERFPDYQGGLRETPGESINHLSDACERLNEVLAISRGIKCPYERGELIDLMREINHRLKAEGDWREPQF